MERKRWKRGLLGLLLMVLCLAAAPRAEAEENFNLLKTVRAVRTKSGVWQKVGKNRRYVYSDGTYAAGTWLRIQGHYYFFDEQGYMLTGWVKYNGYTYFLSRRAARKGQLLTGFQTIGGKKYFFSRKTGNMLKGWVQISKAWYYFDEETGEMAAGTWVNGRYLRKTGKMAVNRFVGTYYVGSDGYVVFQDVDDAQTEDGNSSDTGGNAASSPVETEPEEAATALILVGDSRFVGMQASVSGSGIYIAESGQGYDWLISTADAQIKAQLAAAPAAKVVFNLGVNDTDNVKKYIAYYKQLISEYPQASFYILSVNPMEEKKGSWYCTNKLIWRFNAAMKKALPSYYLDSYEELKSVGYETVDGLHYTTGTYQKIYRFILASLGLE